MDRRLESARLVSKDDDKERRRFGQWFNERCLPCLKTAALIVALPIVVATSAGCGGRTRPLDDYREPDAEIEASVDGDADSDMDVDADADLETDAEVDMEMDADVEMDSDADMDVDVETPGLVMEPLVGDYLNRDLGDREDNIAGDSDSEYSLGGSDSAENANPFTDGSGGSLGPMETFMHRIDGSHTELLEDVMISDWETGDMYLEEQAVWVRGDTHFDFTVDEVVARVDFVAYAARLFTESSDGRGVPVCTDPFEGSDYSSCLGNDWDSASASHRLEITFMGEPWLVLGMDPPSAGLDNENGLVNGGRLVLGKEAMGGIVNQDESLVYGGLRFTLDDIEAHGEVESAIISIYDDDTGEILTRDMISPGQTKEFNISGERYMLHVFNLAPGYTLGDKWADMSLLSRRLELEDGAELNQEEADNEGWTVTLGWKNREGSPADMQPDELRLVSVHSDDVEDISSGGERDLRTGDSFTLVRDPASWEFIYAGLGRRDLLPLQVGMNPLVGLGIPEENGPMDATGRQVGCTFFAPNIGISTGGQGSLYIEADGSESTYGGLVMTATGGHCDGTIGDVGPGAMFHAEPGEIGLLRLYPPSGHEVILFDSSGAASWTSGASIRIAAFEDTELAAYGPLEGGAPDFVITITEDAGNGYVDRMHVGAWTSVPDPRLNGEAMGSDIVFSDDSVLYQAAGPVLTSGGNSNVEEGFVTERGSVFGIMTDTSVDFSIADRVVHTAFFLVPYER